MIIKKKTGICSVANLSLKAGLLAVGAFIFALAVVTRPVYAQLTLGGYTEVTIDDAVEDSVEESVEEALEEALEEEISESVQDQVVDAVEEQLEEQAELTLGGYIEIKTEEQVEDSIDEAIEDEVSDAIESDIAEVVEESLEESIAQDVEEGVEADIEATIEESVEESVASSIEEGVEESVEGSLEEQVAETVEETVEQTVEASVAEAVSDTVEDTVEESVAQELNASVEDSVEASTESQVAANIEDRFDNQVDDIIDKIETSLEVDERRITKEQWLVMAEPEVFEQLADKGYLFDAVTDLPGLGLRLAEVAAPSSFDITEIRKGVIDIVGKERAEVDLNHIYTAGDPDTGNGTTGLTPRDAIDFPDDIASLPVRIGMIDSTVDTAHSSLADASIEVRSFTAPDKQQPAFHGTAVASIIAGNHSDYQGLAPRSQLYAASVFEVDEERGEIASTVSLVRALDWLVSANVDVVNVSLAGPPNRLLEAALGRATRDGMIVMAAAGNGGPVASPMYPAAYESVVAVTAVDERGEVFRLANRGDYLDLAAPGVGLLHANAGGGFVASSGTSFAVPFAAIAAARLRHLQPYTDARAQLFASAVDLGPPGRDSIYGYGLLTPERTLLPTVSKASP
ncbi:MAG: S8 family serine peptidase [Halioglobus sp.]